ncbi:prevent-host-death family protein [Rickettsia bellii]|uniref:Antitoxin n=3 Tax=Rickettsia bellii TaxID=33990 RepID=Q1RH38_RICBR|nr:type II toxin-antitoxin system prevent-host-death family antitoxin [Rickettsia bellii]ABE05326.1 Antitoxin of toxin-antitoxin (TA) system Phd [Rickettsia bellii RML369-C]ABV78585.1 Antitoxin of toxin-antitoxin (TA) system Phd [Rickettsia bellii OSU 85-389]ARD86193.1 prevent-host-death family protein [Rickettsia bellii]KJV90296.1 prevent-host-death family protein [Rickettsia bellii str. RML An4]KJV92793.1 prevent-host-death family protein [Rickettsia bellii str. RML Mogi]
MKTIGMFKTKTHLPELIKDVEAGEELCITNRGRKVAVIIPIDKYYKKKYANIFQEFAELKKRAPLGSVDEILEMKNLGRK